jgi:Cu2+-exporting ATPase
MAELTFDFASYVTRPAAGQAHIDLLVEGVRCANCMAKIENGLNALEGVSGARLNFSTMRLGVDWSEATVSAAAIVRRIGELGFAAKPYDPSALTRAASDESHSLLTAIAVSGAAVVFVMGLTDTTLFGPADMGHGTLGLVRWLSALVAVPATLYASRVFFHSALKSLMARSANMDVPISLAILISLGLSFYQTVAGGGVTYFDAAVMLPFLLLIGRLLDSQLRRRARGAALDLAAMQAVDAHRLDADDHLVAVAASRLRPGDRILLAAGERSPTDGVLESATVADLSFVSGESDPVLLSAGSALHAGAVIIGQSVVLTVSARVENSLVAEIGRLIEAGQQNKSRYVRLADRAASLYVPLVHGLALTVFIVWYLVLHAGFAQSLTYGVALLIVTCPCALGLAVPAVQVVATGKLFRRGIIVKSGDALERLAEIDTVVFDKTGTLTEGRAVLLNADALDPEAMAAAARLARASRHPLSCALVAAAGSGPVAPGARELAGFGVEADDEKLGSAAFVGVAAGLGASELCYRKNAEPVTRFLFGDRLRGDATAAVSALSARDLSITMLTGDHAGAARRTAGEAGIGHWQASVTPAEKVAVLQALAAEGARTLMVGDGLNDAAALATAHVSLSPGSAMDATQAQADIVVRGGGLLAIVDAIDVARQARRRALQNFAVAALYNVVAIPLAALGLVTPLIAAVAMSSSSLIVTLNALRLSLGKNR